MKFAVLSDQHIDCESEPDSWDLARAAFKAAANAKVDHVVLVGDTFDCATAMHRDQDKVQRHLRKLGLWHRDRLTIVVGNHDIFHTPHRGSWVSKAKEAAKILTGSAQDNYDALCEWAGDLCEEDDFLDSEGDLFPLGKDLGDVLLLAGDTTAPLTRYAANGFWPLDQSNLLQSASRKNGQVQVLAIHHPPWRETQLQNIVDVMKESYRVGFAPPDYKRFKRFVDKTELDAIVCGHVHDNDDSPWTWRVGKRGVPAFMMGRSGGVHDATPTFGILSVKQGIAPVWKEHEL